jgi:hypothetical protein
LPVPSQSPLVPQPLLPVSVHWVATVGAAAAGTGEQVPLVPATAQDMQGAVQVLLQQTPCWQKPEAHSAAVLQVVPGVLSVQTPALQTYGETQSVLAVQVVLQAMALPQMSCPEHAPAVTGWQVPVPLQVCAGVSVEPEQIGAAHCVPVG